MIKVFKYGFILLLSAFLIVPFLIPHQTSGTQTKEQALELVPQLTPNFVKLAGIDIHYEIAGDIDSENLIVLLHGFGASTFSWHKVIQDLSQEALVIAYDRPAFGFSERPAEWNQINPYGLEGQLIILDELIQQFGADKEITLVGHSAGGRIAAEYEVAYPQKIENLILLAPALSSAGGTPNWLSWLFKVPQINELGPYLVEGIATSGLALLDRSYFDSNLITDEIKNGYTAPLNIFGWERAFWEFTKAQQSSEFDVSRITSTTFFITGDSDTVVPTDETVKNYQLISNNSKLRVIKNSGHLPNEENPREFVEAVLQFIK